MKKTYLQPLCSVYNLYQRNPLLSDSHGSIDQDDAWAKPNDLQANAEEEQESANNPTYTVWEAWEDK